MATAAEAPAVVEAPTAPEKAAIATEAEMIKGPDPTKPEEDDNKMAKSTNEPAAKKDDADAENDAADEGSQTAEEEEPAPPAKTLFVSNISWKVKELELRAPFEEHGTVDDCKIVTYWDKSESRIKSKGYGFVTFSTIEEATKALNTMHGEMLQGRDLVCKFSNSTGPKGKTKKELSEEGDEAEQKGEAPEEENEGEPTKGEPSKRRGRRKKNKEGAAQTTAEEKKAEAAPNPNYRTLIVRALPFEASKEEVSELFKDIEVQEIEVKRSRRTKANSQRAYAFFTFATHDLAKKALENAKGLKIGENELTVEVANQQPEDRLKEKARRAVKKPDTAAPKDAGEEHGGRKRLFVKGISEKTTEETLSEHFAKFGPLTKCTVRKGKSSDLFAYVNFRQAEHAEKALEATNEETFEGGTLSVQYARSRSRRFRVKKAGDKPQAEA